MYFLFTWEKFLWLEETDLFKISQNDTPPLQLSFIIELSKDNKNKKNDSSHG